MPDPSEIDSPVTIAFSASEGIELVADSWGDPEAHPVLFLHGGGQTRHSWGGAARTLAAKGWRTITMDLRGHGESGWSPSGAYELSDFASDVHCALDQLGRPAVLVGASLGGVSIVAAVGESENDICAGIILVDIAPKAEKVGIDRIHNFMHGNLDGFATVEEAADAVAAYRKNRSRPKDISGLHKNLRLREDGRYYWHWDPRFLGRRRRSHADFEQRLRNAVKNFRVPTLLVRGQNSDVLSMEGVKDFMSLAPHAEFADVSGAGHMVAGDQNDIFTNAVVDFLSRTFDRTR